MCFVEAKEDCEDGFFATDVGCDYIFAWVNGILGYSFEVSLVMSVDWGSVWWVIVARGLDVGVGFYKVCGDPGDGFV